MVTTVPTALFLIAAGAVAAVAVLFLRERPKVAFVAWVLVLFFVPVWVGAVAGFFWAAITAFTVLLIVVNGSVVPLHVADVWMAAFVVVIVGLLGLGAVGLSAVVIAVLEWVIPYVWGRVLLARVGTAVVTSTIAVVAVVAAGLAIVEFVTSFNLFVLIPGSGIPYETWSPLQMRGGVIRAEGAFGHSIALGAALAMASAFVVAARWRIVPKVLAIAVITAATVMTFSRIGLVTLVLTLVVSTFLIQEASWRFRIVITLVGGLATVAVVPIVDAVFGAAGQEAAGSAGYRTDLLVLLSQVKLFGNPGEWQTLVTGDYYLGYFARSIDNSLILMLLRFGYVPTALLIGVLLCLVARLLKRGRRSPAALAVACQLPSLVVVALITQYGMLLWFCVGLAISWPANVSPEGRSADYSVPVARSAFSRNLVAKTSSDVD